MKKILLSIIYFLGCLLSIQAQTLYGITFYGGTEGGGTINKFIPATNTLTVAKSLESFVANPVTNFIQASDGKLYSMIPGSGGNGLIFSFDYTSSTFKKLQDFAKDGSDNSGSLVQASDGKLYGMTHGGGSSGKGVIFSVDPLSSTYIKLKDFDNATGGSPTGNLMLASNGKLYGMTSEGGSFGLGVIFSFDPSASTYTKLKDFDNTNGANPFGNLIQASDGKIYGMTYAGGTNGHGVIFSFDPSASAYSKLKDFDNPNGDNPFGDLMQASDGKLYGMTYGGGSSNLGVIFSFDPSTSTYTKLKDFDNNNGARPFGNLVQASDGKLYGMTPTGGSSGNGVIFSIDPSASTYTKLKDFDNTDGANPNGSLMQASDGKLYSMTRSGGTSGHGVIFSFDPSASAYTKVVDFGNNESGSNVFAALVQASDGKLYGMTNAGGSNGIGVIFSLDPSTSTYKKLMDFDSIKGRNPIGGLIQATDGKLYGMAGGGSNGLGVIFSYDPSASIYTKLMDFDSIKGGASGTLLQASDGKLYGMTGGGSGGFGTIFSFDPSTSLYTNLRDFDITNGGFPQGSLMQAKDGKLYGMTSRGGIADNGVIFSFDPTSSTYIKVMDFGFSDGLIPLGNSLIQADDGKLYGMTDQGGSSGAGIIFSLDPSTSIFTSLKDFDYGGDGVAPYGSLVQASDGKLYGMTYYGGINNSGVIFSFDPSSDIYTRLKDYDGANGANPFYGNAFIELRECTTSTTYYKDSDNDGFGNPDSSLQACTHPAGYVTNNTDCNDSNAAIHAPVTYYRDKDGDGLGNRHDSISVCETTPPAGYVRNNFDCDDHFKPWRYWDAKILMCHHGKEECVKRKDVLVRLFQGWTLGPCSNSTCGPNEILMCHKGQEECVKRKDVWFKLFHGWTLGACFPGSASSQNANDISENGELDKELPIPGQYKLSNYPNPFAGTTTIKYELPTDSKVSIIVYDLLGRVVATLVDENKKAGTYTIDFNAGHVNKGSLYYRIIATSKDKQFKQTNKMIQLQ